MPAPFALSESSTQLLAQGWSLALVSISRRRPPHLWLPWPVDTGEGAGEKPVVHALLTPTPLDAKPFLGQAGGLPSLVSESARRRLAARARAQNTRGANGKPQRAQRFFSDIFHISLDSQTHEAGPRLMVVSLDVAYSLGVPAPRPELRRCLRRGERGQFQKSPRFIKKRKIKTPKETARERLSERLLAYGGQGNTEWASTTRAIRLTLRAEFPLARFELLPEPPADQLRQWRESRGLIECGRYFWALVEREALARAIEGDSRADSDSDWDGQDGRKSSGRRQARI